MNPAAQAAADHIARRGDEVVLAALNKRLGREVLEPASLADRVHVAVDSTGATYSLDGEPFLWLGMPRITQDEQTGVISVDREWRELP